MSPQIQTTATHQAVRVTSMPGVTYSRAKPTGTTYVVRSHDPAPRPERKAR